MVETGLFFQRALPVLNLPIVVTGAITQLAFEGSDGSQNLTESLLAVQFVAAGVHVVMHNQVLPVHRARKDHKLGRFVWGDEAVKERWPWCLWCLLWPEIGCIHAEQLKELKQART